jgi:hypothetical protein
LFCERVALRDVGEAGGCFPVEQGQLPAEGAHHLPQRPQPGWVAGGQRQLVEERGTTGAEQVAHRHRDALLGHHAVGLVAAVGAQAHQLVPTSHPFPQLPGSQPKGWAEGCLQDHLRARSGLGDLPLEPGRVAVEADHLAQLLPVRCHAHQDRAPPVQVHSHPPHTVVR